MSIIHDALKKAEASKAASKPAGTPADPAAELLAKMAPVKKKNAASPRLIVLLSTLFLAIVAFAFFGRNMIHGFLNRDEVSVAANPVAPTADVATSSDQIPTTAPNSVPPNQAEIVPAPDQTTESEKKQQDAEKLSDEFLSLYEKENYAEALKAIEALIMLKPTEPIIYNDYGVLLKRLGRTREALEAYNKALALSPDYAEAQNNAAAIYIADRNYAEAKDLLQKALDKKPDYLDAMLNIAIAYEKNDELEKAKKWYQDFLQKSEGRVDKKIRLHIEERLVSLSEL